MREKLQTKILKTSYPYLNQKEPTYFQETDTQSEIEYFENFN